MANLNCNVNISTGTINITWEVYPLYVTTDITSGFLIKNITGYEFPADYFGHILQLAETENGYSFKEEGLQNNNVDEDSMSVLEAIKRTTISNNPDL